MASAGDHERVRAVLFCEAELAKGVVFVRSLLSTWAAPRKAVVAGYMHSTNTSRYNTLRTFRQPLTNIGTPPAITSTTAQHPRVTRLKPNPESLTKLEN